MSRDLILALHESGRVDWSIIDRRDGQRLHEGYAAAGEALEIDALDSVERTLCLLPSETVYLTRLDLPARSEREARQAAPFLVEDEIASPLEATAVMPGPRGSDGRRWVMAADKARVEDWIERIEPVAVRPLHVLPDCLAAADREAVLTLFDRGDMVLFTYSDEAIQPGQPAGGALDGSLFGSLAGPLVQAAGEGEIAASASLGLTGENFRALERQEIDRLASALPEAELAALPPFFGDRFRSTFDWSSFVRPMIRPAWLAAALLLGFIALIAGEGMYYRLQAERFDEATVAEFRAAVPEVQRTVIPAEAERLLGDRLAGLGGGGTSSFLQLTSALAELTSGNEQVRIDRIRFDQTRAALSVSAVYTDFGDFDALDREAGRIGLRLEDGGARESGGEIRGEFTVRLQ